MADTGVRDVRGALPMRVEETKPSLRTTEFYVYLASVAAVLIASFLVGQGDGDRDFFRADRAWWYISLLTIGYLISRGLAKAGNSWRRSDDSGPGIQMGSQPGRR